MKITDIDLFRINKLKTVFVGSMQYFYDTLQAEENREMVIFMVKNIYPLIIKEEKRLKNERVSN